MNTPRVNCPANEKNLSSLSIWYSISKGDFKMDDLANKSCVVDYKNTRPSSPGQMFPQSFLTLSVEEREKSNMASLLAWRFITVTWELKPILCFWVTQCSAFFIKCNLSFICRKGWFLPVYVCIYVNMNLIANIKMFHQIVEESRDFCWVTRGDGLLQLTAIFNLDIENTHTTYVLN